MKAEKEDGILRTYEALIIFAETVKEDTVNQAMDAFGAEVERQGGAVLDRMSLGRRPFARPLKKRDSGLYGKVYFTMDPANIEPLKKRCKFVNSLFRIQIIALPKGYRKAGVAGESGVADDAQAADGAATATAIPVAESVTREVTDGVNE